MFMSTEDNFLFSHFPSVIYMTINVVDSLKWARAQIIFLPMGGSKGSFTGQLWDFEMSLL